MTTHRINEAITFVSWMHVGALHIRRPRSQTALAYCDERVIETKRLPLVRDFTIEHPDEIPLEIRIERDFANLCPKCARMFFNEVAKENAALRWSGVLVSVPIAWQAIYTRTGRSPWIQEKIENEARDTVPTVHEEQITRDELSREGEDEARDAIDAEAAEHAEDDSLERDSLRNALELDDGRTWDGSL